MTLLFECVTSDHHFSHFMKGSLSKKQPLETCRASVGRSGLGGHVSQQQNDDSTREHNFVWFKLCMDIISIIFCLWFCVDMFDFLIFYSICFSEWLAYVLSTSVLGCKLSFIYIYIYIYCVPINELFILWFISRIDMEPSPTLTIHDIFHTLSLFREEVVAHDKVNL